MSKHQSKPVIIADNREKNSLVIAQLHEFDAEVQLQHLKLADYLIGNVAIERKTVNDFVNSMLNKRLPAQLRDLKANYQKPLLLIEGLDDENIYRPSQHPSIHENAIRGMLLAVAIDFQIPIIFTKDYVDTATYLLLLAKRQLRPEREISLKVKRKTFSLAEQQQLIIEGFPGIGPALAKALLKKFGTIKAFINASEKQLKSIPKLGKKADLIKRLIETKYNYLC